MISTTKPSGGQTRLCNTEFKDTFCTYQPILDRVTISGDLVYPKRFRRGLDLHMDFLDFASHSAYNGCLPCKLLTVSHVHVELDEHVGKIRMDWNPSKHHEEATLVGLVLRHMKNKYLTRYDVAINYDRDLSGYGYTMNRRRKENFFLSQSGKVETHYLGTRKSGGQVKIYDKAVEQGLETTLWRIEEEVKLKPTDTPWMYLPFDKLWIWRTKSDGQGVDNMVLDALIRDPGRWSELTRRQQEKYRKLIGSYEVEHLEPHPKMIWVEKCKSVLDTLHRYLEDARKVTFSEYTQEGRWKYAQA